MNTHKLLGKTLCVALACLMTVVVAAVAAFAPAKAHAATAIDVNARASLELSLAPDGSPAQGAQFSLYRVADVSLACEFTPTSAFAGYDLSFEDTTAETWTSMAQSLAELVSSGTPLPDAKAATNAQGTASFADLPVGLYLVTGEPTRVGSSDVVPAPFMVCLPSLSSADEWLYDVTADVKYQVIPDTPVTPDTPKGKLPQTGQLWWPVPVLLLAGAALAAFGATRLRRG